MFELQDGELSVCCEGKEVQAIVRDSKKAINLLF